MREAILRPLLEETARRAARYVAEVQDRRVAPSAQAVACLDALDGPLPAEPADPVAVLAQLDEFGSPATVATTGGRYFGFVNGGVLPAALGANWLAGAWGQHAGLGGMAA